MSAYYVVCPKCEKRALSTSIEKYGSCSKCAQVKKMRINKETRKAVWEKYFGTATSGHCRCSEIISIKNHHCGHKLAESKGGETTIDNLEPICGHCNCSMGSKNMNDHSDSKGYITDMDAINTKTIIVISDDEDGMEIN